MNRADKLAKLDSDKAAKGMVIVSNGEPFVEALQKKIDNLKATLGEGVEITNLDDLVDQLGVLQSFQSEVKHLKQAIGEIKLPESVEVKGLESLVESIKRIASKKEKDVVVEAVDLSPVTKAIVDLTLKVEQQQVPDQGQQPSDYIPTRRVVKVGKKLMYDDSFYTGGGGGSSVPVINQAVPVVNEPSGTLQVSDTASRDGLDELTTVLNSLKFLSAMQSTTSTLRVGIVDNMTGITIGAVTTVTSVTNQVQSGGFALTHDVMSSINTNANQLRDRITVT